MSRTYAMSVYDPFTEWPFCRKGGSWDLLPSSNPPFCNQDAKPARSLHRLRRKRQRHYPLAAVGPVGSCKDRSIHDTLALVYPAGCRGVACPKRDDRRVSRRLSCGVSANAEAGDAAMSIWFSTSWRLFSTSWRAMQGLYRTGGTAESRNRPTMGHGIRPLQLERSQAFHSASTRCLDCRHHRGGVTVGKPGHVLSQALCRADKVTARAIRH